jgi:hypothetical protein
MGRDQELPAVKLLVSVRDASEVASALAGGADLIDLKEPRRGPLGAMDEATAERAIAAVGGVVPVTAALGELADPFPWVEVPPGLAVVKAGLAGAGPSWRQCAETLQRRVPTGVALALAAYADHEAAASPEPLEVAKSLGDLGVEWLVIDTWRKDGRTSLDLLEGDALCEVIGVAEGSSVKVVLAGALSAQRIVDAAGYRPAVVGVRGAVCRGGREGVVKASLVAALRRKLDATDAATLAAG